MKVLLTSTDNPYITKVGGKHIHLLLLERGLKLLGVQVTTLYYNKKSPKELFKRYASVLLPEQLRYKVKLESMINYLEKHIPNQEFDLIHAHDILSLLAMHSKYEKKVLTVHGYFAKENLEFLKNVKEKVKNEIYNTLLTLERKGVRKADYIITVDNRLKTYIVSELKYPKNRIDVVYNAIDTNCFQPVSDKNQKELKKVLGYHEKDFVILVPRRLVKKNGVIHAVYAMKYVKRQNVKMIIAGDGPEKRTLVREAQNDQRIYFAGIIPHTKIDFYYKLADVILIPSITSHGVQEATSLAMLEGMSCGKIVICSNIGGMSEVVKNMENGILVKEKSPLAIAKAIENVLEDLDLRAKITNKARAYILQTHSFISHTKKIIQIYKSLLNEKYLLQ